MTPLLTNAEVKTLVFPFLNYDERYIAMNNYGIVEEQYLKPLMNDFFTEFMTNSASYTNILDDVKRAVALLVAARVIHDNGGSKTQNLGELEAFTRNSKTAPVERREGKAEALYLDAMFILQCVGVVMIEAPTDYPDFAIEKAFISIDLYNTLGLV